ncbi:MAG: PIG-L family deacetylase [Bacteroidota bacterium]
MKKILQLLLLFVVLSSSVLAQRPEKPNSSDILLKLRKLNFLGNVLYVAAHPDDENTRFIAYMSNEKLANTAYLSLTRGDGGQNLIGPEIREGLGVIRTQELLAARRTDGGSQFFSRANDFGYSKSTEETQKIWDRDQVMSDVVWVYRKFRPDVIITRFPPDRRAGHGHHTTSAIFAEEAFDISGDKTKYSDQLKYTQVWRPKRLYTNTGRWWNPNMTGDEEGVITYDVGGYNPLLGKSYPEIAALSRSQHKSQGFGSTGTRGRQLEFLEHRVGQPAKDDIFEGIDTSWGRVKGGQKIGELIESAIDKYDPMDPSAILPQLLSIRDNISGLNDQYWNELKLSQIDIIIKDVLGLYLEVRTNDFTVAPGNEVTLSIEAINRSSVPVKLTGIDYASLADSTLSTSLNLNDRLTFKKVIQIPADMDYSQPYWLKNPGTLGMYVVNDRQIIGKPENDPALIVRFEIDISGKKLTYTLPVIYKWSDPVKGELYRPFEVSPPVVANIPETVYIFSDREYKTIEINLKSSQKSVKGEVMLQSPDGWKINPASQPFQLNQKGEEGKYSFKVLPPEGQSVGDLKAIVNVGGKQYSYSRNDIAYDHIPTQMLLPESKARLVKIDIKKKGQIVGYIQGAGDAIPAALREIGYEVWEMKDEEVTPANLKKLDAVILGVRALNTNDRIPFYMDDLLKYTEDGGTMIVQYNTNRRLKTNKFSPYNIKLSRDRVTDENAKVTILKPEHPVLNTPNKITEEDFEGWVQERGLYFPNEWDNKYEAILSSHDEGEDDRNGGLLVAKYGKGHYIYTGYSWFRELPAGVPGAFRLFVNLVSLGQEDEQPDASKLVNRK